MPILTSGTSNINDQRKKHIELCWFLIALSLPTVNFLNCQTFVKPYGGRIIIIISLISGYVCQSKDSELL
jgi:hypothetical protein